MFIVKNELNYG